MKERYIKQGDIFFCSDIADTIGSEQKWNRPVIIISVKALNKGRENVIVIPITSEKKIDMVTHYSLNNDDYRFLTYEDNTALLENLSDVSKWRLGEKFGKLTADDLKNIIELTKYLFKDYYIDNPTQL